MPKRTTNATQSQGNYCCNCGDPVGNAVKRHPVNVTDAVTGKPDGTWCPRCFAWKRMQLEPERFNASCTLAVRCQFCSFVTVCFAVQPDGRAFCGHCQRPGAMPVQPDKGELEAVFRGMQETAEELRG